MMDDYESQMKKRSSSQKVINVKPKVGLNDREKAIIKWLTIIVKKSLPVSYVEDEDIRDFAECKSPISAKTLRGVLLSLVELVEKDRRGNERKERMYFTRWVVSRWCALLSLPAT